MDRRLTTIVAADMVGYSRLMAADEEGTLTRLRAARTELIDSEIAAAGGRIVKTMGDGLLVEFPSPVSAVRAVIAVQEAMRVREADQSKENRVVFRVGVNLGDVIIDGDDIMGDGVNIAARLEGLAEPGGIVISSSVYEQVKGKVDCSFIDLGPQQVKNIPELVNCYAVMLDGATAAKPTKKTKIGTGGMMVAAVAVVAIAIASFLTLSRPTDVLADLPAVGQTPSAGSLIVLPFHDYSVDKSLEHFADGLTEDLITDLARWKEFRVIARNTSMTYKGKSMDAREIANETNTRYVLEGSVRRIGDEMRITAQLINGENGGHVWAKRFEETSSDVLALQDSVIGKIVQTLIGTSGVVREDEYARTWVKAATDLDEYDYYLRGHSLFYRFTPEDMARAVDIWKEGLEKYPNSGLLRIKLAWGYMISTTYQFPQHRQPYPTILELAEAGLEDPRLPPAGHRFGLWLVGAVNSALGNREATIEALSQVVRSYPFDAEGLFFSVGYLTRVGAYDQAEQLLGRALELNYEMTPVNQGHVATLRYAQKDCARAVPLLNAFLNNPINLLLLAGCYADDGRTDAAAALLTTASSEFDIKSPADFPTFFEYMPGVPDRLVVQLAKVGWPE